MKVYVENIIGTSVSKIPVDTSKALGVVFVLGDGTKIRVCANSDNSNLIVDGDGRISIEPRAANCVWIRCVDLCNK